MHTYAIGVPSLPVRSTSRSSFTTPASLPLLPARLLNAIKVILSTLYLFRFGESTQLQDCSDNRQTQRATLEYCSGQHTRVRDRSDHCVEDLRPTVVEVDPQPQPVPVGRMSVVLLQSRQPTTKLLPAWLTPCYQPRPPTAWHMARPRIGGSAKGLRRTRRFEKRVSDSVAQRSHPLAQQL
jgi:hypothetical protein